MGNKMTSGINETSGIHVEGHLKIFCPETSQVFVNKRNAIHFENMSYALAQSLANVGQGYIQEMVLGNGGTSIDPTGIITYLTPNVSGTNASLYNQTYSKVVNPRSSSNSDPTRNKTEIRHVTGTTYTDILISCLLDYGEPDGQAAYDNVSDMEQSFVFDEIGLRSFSSSGTGRLLTHVIFHPVQKSLNRLIQIDYTIRVQSLSGFNEV
jgi:hypothetical protein